MNPLKWLFRKPTVADVCNSLTGEWRGHYLQHDTKHRIVAIWIQDGDQISGQMSDLDTLTERSLFDAVASAGLPPGTDEQFAEQIRRLIPNADSAPIMTRSILPGASLLEGTISGEFVRFTKKYQGECIQSYQIGEKGIGRATPGHSVEYTGRLSADRNAITGQWTIYQPGVSRGFIDGGFELRRSSSTCQA